MVGATLTKPTFVNHDNGAIFAIDCHPSEEKFITCGQKGESSNGLVIVWNMAPVLDGAKCSKENVPKMLFQMQTQSSVNSCRWSPDGRRFAFGSDDSSVSVWEYVGRINSMGSVTGGAGNVERYKECCILRGHSMEVLAVEWSQNGRFLASSSMDHKILVYNARKLPDKIATLSGSESAVKGLAWDPIGKYLASLEGDKKLKLWATDSWQCVTTIDEPFEDSKEETMFSRLDWSPDGKYLLTPAAVKDGQPLIKLIQRQTWRADHHLAGHRKGTTCVRSLPRIVRSELRNGKRVQLTCAAVGSRDKSVSIWLFPGTVKPVMVIDNIFHHSVMDFAWCGTNLLVCSFDGTVKVITLEEQLLGEMLTDHEMSDLCYQIYSIRPPQYEETSSSEAQDTSSHLSVEPNAVFSTSSSAAANASFLTCPEEVLNKRKFQKMEDRSVPGTSKKTAESVDTPMETDPPKENSEAKAKEQRMIEERSKQTEERKDGKRRIQPIFLASTALGATESSSQETVATTSTRRAPPPATSSAPPPKKRIALAADEVDLETSSDSEDEDEEDEEEEEDNTSGDEEQRQPTRKRKLPGDLHPMLAMDLKKPVLRPMEPKSLQTKEGTVLMEAPEQQTTLSQQVQERKNMLVEVDNRWKHGGVETSQVRVVKRREVDGAGGAGGSGAAVDEALGAGAGRKTIQETVWMVVVGAPVIIVAANKHFVMLGCGDKCIRVYRTLCGSLLVSLRLDSLPVLIGIKEHAAYGLTENGRLSTWNLKTLKAVISRQPLFDCVETASSDNSLMSVDVSESGVPLIVFSNGSIYTFNVGLACWMQAITANVLARLTTPIADCSSSDFPTSSGPLTRLLKRMRRQTTAPGVSPHVSRAVKESQLEQLVHCAEQLGNPQDYQTMLNLYVEALCESGSEKKLKNVISELSKSGAPLQVCGLRRAALCDDVTRMIRLRQPAIADRIVGGAATSAKTRTLF